MWKALSSGMPTTCTRDRETYSRVLPLSLKSNTLNCTANSKRQTSGSQRHSKAFTLADRMYFMYVRTRTTLNSCNWCKGFQDTSDAHFDGYIHSVLCTGSAAVPVGLRCLGAPRLIFCVRTCLRLRPPFFFCVKYSSPDTGRDTRRTINNKYHTIKLYCSCLAQNKKRFRRPDQCQEKVPSTIVGKVRHVWYWH